MRIGGAQYARILQLMLNQRGYKVFLDYDELTDGKFEEHIQEAITDAQILMLVLSKEALVRCKNDGDWVRREIQLAIQEGKHIIPINPDTRLTEYLTIFQYKIRGKHTSTFRHQLWSKCSLIAPC